MGSTFDEIYRIVARIPAGKVATYGQIAALLGHPRGARTVGWAMHDAPRELDLPCHRVVNVRGALSPEEIFGPGRQRALLEGEGVTFRRNGCIDLERYLWDPRAGRGGRRRRPSRAEGTHRTQD